MFALAWRNLWRNRGRTLIVIVAIAFSLGLMLVSYGMTLDRKVKLMEVAVRAAGGNVLVHASGFWDARTSDLQMVDGPDVMERVAAVDGVTGVIPRVLITGLLTSSRGAEGVQITGIDPEQEATLYDMRQHVVEGEFFGPGDERVLVLGSGLVERLEVSLGDRLVLTATAPDGEVTRALFRLSGVITTGNGLIDDAVGYTSIHAARAALGMDTHLTQLGVLIEDDAQRASVAAAVVEALRDDGRYEVLAWDEALPDLLGIIEIDDRFGAIYGLVIFLVVAFGIANTLMMMVMERVRELGMLNAIGMSGRRIMTLVLGEAAWMTAVSVVIGVGIGFGLHLLLVKYGIDMSEVAGSDVEIGGVSMNDTVIRSEFDAVRWAVATSLVVALVFVSALYPAWRASRLDPVESMRTYG